MIFEIEQEFENSSKLVIRAESLTLSFYYYYYQKIAHCALVVLGTLFAFIAWILRVKVLEFSFFTHMNYIPSISMELRA